MKVMRRSRWLARLVAVLVVGVVGVAVAAAAPAQAGIVFQSHIVASWTGVTKISAGLGSSAAV